MIQLSLGTRGGGHVQGAVGRLAGTGGGGDRGRVVLPGGSSPLWGERGSAVRWAALVQEAGSVAPGPLGGDRRSGQIEVHAALILRLVDQKSDITLREIQAQLAKAGVAAGIGTLWRFFDRRRMTRKKR